MRVVTITSPGGPEVLQIAEKPVPSPKENEVLIRIKAAGINRPDLFQRKGNYPAPKGVPQDVPGLEVAGIIEECGPGTERWRPGDSVCALLGGGGYAEYAVVHEGHCLPLPGNSFTEAAALPETIFTVWHNVFQSGRLKQDENFLVHGGAGGIGSTAIQLARCFGAQVFATAGSDEKCRLCEDLGASRAINYKKEDFEEILKEEGIDVILDAIGGDYITKNIRILNPGGRLVFINAVKGGRGEFDVFDIMSRRLVITGSTLRPRDATFKKSLAEEVEKPVWPLIRSGQFRPEVTATFPLEAASEAHRIMEDNSHVGKIVLVV